MGIDCKVCLEAMIESRWTHLTCFQLEKKDYTLYERLGYNSDRRADGPPPENWTAVSKWLFVTDGGQCPVTLTLENLRVMGEQRRLEQPDRFDLRPGWIPPFQEWLETVVWGEPLGWDVSGFLAGWLPDSPPEYIGSEIRLCIWFN